MQKLFFLVRARGNYSKYSDFDILVVLKNRKSVSEKVHLATLLRQRLAARLIAADVLVKDQSEVAYLEDKPGNVVRNALREGMVL
ncbi:MAG: nucleotidyltransferase domain-containing protein [Elusimicrobia bacterium]|nr:nucleotidyltransferase domain-containing protein [Elusimicrobiota bacterium]